MKKILFIALLLTVPFIGFSQTIKPIDGFLGIKFGSSKADVIAAVKAKGGVLYKDTTDQLTFTNVKLGHFASNVFFVFFNDDKAYQGQFAFKDDVDDKTIDYYNNLVSQINEIYGTGKSRRDFRGTFKDGDGYEITAIQEGDADYATLWFDSIKNSLKASISDKLVIYLDYQDIALAKDAIAKRKAKEKGDF